MRILTFKGFLKSYVQSLAGTNTTSIRKLAMVAQTQNPRLCHALALYAFADNKIDQLAKATCKDSALNKAVQQLNHYSWLELENALAQDDSHVQAEYQKVYRSYLSVRDRHKSDNHTKSLMHKKITDLKMQKTVSNYRIYTTLGLNPGNANAFLKNADTSKLSLDTARKILAYLTAL